MKIQVRGLALVSGALTRRSIADIVEEYGGRHPKVRRVPLLKISFVKIVVYEGQEWGGLQYGDTITISARSTRGRKLNVHELVQLLYHELYHLSVNGGGATKTSCKGRLQDYDPSEWREEIAAILSANTELDNWSARICREYSLDELKAIAPYAKDWPKN